MILLQNLITQSAIMSCHWLFHFTAVDDDTGVTLVALLMPTLISLLLDEQAALTAMANRRFLSDSCLSKLLQLRQQYPDHFRSVMSGSPHLCAPLAAAVIHSSHAAQQHTQVQSAAAVSPAQLHKPTIQLTMDFSKFKT